MKKPNEIKLVCDIPPAPTDPGGCAGIVGGKMYDPASRSDWKQAQHTRVCTGIQHARDNTRAPLLYVLLSTDLR